MRAGRIGGGEKGLEDEFARLLRIEPTPDDLNELVMKHSHRHGGFGTTAVREATKQEGVGDHSCATELRGKI